MKKNSVEIRAAINQKIERCKEIVNLAKTEVRDLTDEEEKELEDLKTEVEEKKRELDELEKKLREYDEMVPDEPEDEEEPKEEKNHKRAMNKNITLVKEIRNALNTNNKTFKINAETRTMTVNGDGVADGVHDHTVETEIQGILEPLYANSVLTKLGVRWYSGLPMGDVQVPIMGKGTCGWQSEIGPASATGNTFTSKKLTPKRLTAYVDISKQLLAQDNIGVEAAIRRDIVNALNDKLEATIFGTSDKTDYQPAGIFYNQISGATELTTFQDVCLFESSLDDENISGERKYLLGNGAKAYLRSTVKGNANVGMIMDANTVDGTPALNTSNVAGGSTNKMMLAYGDWSALAIGSWGDIEITLDEYTQAVNGCIRLVVNAFFDAVVLRPEALAFGKCVPAE